LNIQGLLEFIKEMPEYHQLLDDIAQGHARVKVIEEAKPYLLAAIFQHLQKPILVLTAQPETSRKFTEQISTWLGFHSARQMPEPDGLPYQRVNPDITSELDKIQILSALVHYKAGSDIPIVLASAPALMQKLPSASLFRQADINLTLRMSIAPMKLLADLNNLGYFMANMVEIPGQVSRRGGIIDIYPPTSAIPVRVEFFGNSIDSMRLFEPINQRSIKPITEINIGLADLMAPLFIGTEEEIKQAFLDYDSAELNYETRQSFENTMAQLLEKQKPDNMYYYSQLFNKDNLLNYLPTESLVIIDNVDDIQKEMHFVESEASLILNEKILEKEIPVNFPKPYFTWSEIGPEVRKYVNFEIIGWRSTGDSPTINLDFKSGTNHAGRIPAWLDNIRQMSSQGKRIIAVSHQANRLADMLSQEGLAAKLTEEINELPGSRSITLIQGLLSHGWIMCDEFYLFTDNELFGFLKQQRQVKRRHVTHHRIFVDIKQGDYVVHVEHGIGKFSGVITMNTNGLTREYLLLQYAGGDRLYVPTDQIDRVGRYIGSSDNPPNLSRLGSQEWIKSKDKARQAAEEIARELLELYALREIQQGFAYSPDNTWQVELEASFPYVETSDQLTAIAQIKEDMSQPKPMDRLICGDVGYGKTEVALRAAFKAVMDGKQVAVLVPTTVLAQQHYATFQERLRAFPLKLDVLSRFRSNREQKEVVEALAQGKVDIIIGTHRLLQKDIVFKDLGLLIIDEEQRFGVGHKEYLKRFRHEVDVLTLSATPIPRTLHMSLVGVRDMSVMETPPEDRLPIKTLVAEYDERLIREAIMREIERNGQVFFVHNRVQSIILIADKLKKLVPEARIGIGHGQMNEQALELVMSDFTQGNLDVLVCTTIIESGLDVPNANTLIINQADKFGLTQLYQLRGRVGRGTNLAYAYFLYDKGKRLTADADKRLQTIFETTELGAGFGIAMKDLEIRGAGNILGVRQSGHINAVGFSLYTQLLTEAVEDLKTLKAHENKNVRAVKPARLPQPTIDLPLPAFIPGEYVNDTNTRLSIYQRLASSNSIEHLVIIGNELKDRFGSLPVEAQNLLYAARIKILATRTGITSVSCEAGYIILRKSLDRQFDTLIHETTWNGVRVSPNQVRLNLTVLGQRWQAILEEILNNMELNQSIIS
jgi:transcription-repair coupling factor (superfamily II helicase)